MYVEREPARWGCIAVGKYPPAEPLRAPSANRRIHLRDPVGRGKNVIVDKSNDRAAGLLDPSIPSATQSLRGLKNVAHLDGRTIRKCFHDVCGVVLGVVVDDDDLPFDGRGNLLGGKSIECAREERGSLVGGNDCADLDRHLISGRTATPQAIS